MYLAALQVVQILLELVPLHYNPLPLQGDRLQLFHQLGVIKGDLISPLRLGGQLDVEL